MKLLLIHPSQRVAYGDMTPPSCPPFGIAYIASFLEREGREVSIIDVDAEGLNMEGLGKEIEKLSPDLVGITATTPLIKNAFEIARIAKSQGRKVVLGGIHPTVNPEECMLSEYVDFVVVGEGELTTLELLKALEENGNFSNIDGLVYKENGEIIANPPRRLIKDLDIIPFPARHLFKNFKYSYPDTLKTPAIPIMTSRGCPGQCTYCCTKQICGLSYRFRSAENVIAEIEELIEKYGAKEIHFSDDNFVVNKERILELCKKIKERGLHEKVLFAVPQGLRVDQVDEEVLRALRGINVYSLGFGVESGNENVLKTIKKNTSLEQARKAIALSKKLGFEVWTFFIIGLPGDNEETIKDTVDFALELDTDLAKFLILKPFPGTEAFKWLDERGLIVDKDYDKYGVYGKPSHKLPEVSQERMVEIQRKAYKKFYLRPKKIIQHVLRIKSFRRLKLNAEAAISLFKLTRN